MCYNYEINYFIRYKILLESFRLALNHPAYRSNNFLMVSLLSNVTMQGDIKQLKYSRRNAKYSINLMSNLISSALV